MPKKTPALAYLRTSSATNVGGDSDARQREAIANYAARSGIQIEAEFYDAAVSGTDPVDQRDGFTALLAYAKEHAISTVLVETANRFARDLIVQETGHALLKQQGIALIAADDPDAFTADTPTAKLVRQIMGAVAEFDKAMTVAKLRGARDRASAATGHRIEGRKGYDQTKPELVREAKRLARKSPKSGKARSLREIAAELATLGFVTARGTTFSAGQVRRLLDNGR